jgi:protein-L-isoaspartate(D-aspartate) O-methyltransferase
MFQAARSSRVDQAFAGLFKSGYSSAAERLLPNLAKKYNDAVSIDLAHARDRMVADQLRLRGIADARVLDAMRSVLRERFVPSELREHAYDDSPLPIGSGQTISQPYMVALTCEAAQLSGAERVLEVGTGSGYEAAILSKLAAQVVSIECNPHFYDRARLILQSIGAPNVEVRLGDGSLGCIEEAPFDVIIVSAAMPGIPTTLLAQLKPDGRLVAPIGEEELQTLVRIGRRGGHWQEEYFGECRFVKMTGKHGFVE